MGDYDRDKADSDKASYRKQKKKREKERSAAVLDALHRPPEQPLLAKALQLNTQKGCSSWLTALPLERYHFTLTRPEWHDAMALRYLLPPPALPAACACGQPNSVTHAQCCHLGGYLGLRHDAVRDSIASFLERAGCKSVEKEQHMTQMSQAEKETAPAGANVTDGARMDVTAIGVWGPLQKAYCDIRVFDPVAPSKESRALDALFLDNEAEKKRAYAWRVREIEHGSFTPLVFSVFGGTGRECDVFLKTLAEKTSKKTKETPSDVLAWMRTVIAFSLIRTALICLRGWRHKKRAAQDTDEEDEGVAVALASVHPKK